MLLKAPGEDEILRKESEGNFAQRSRYLLKFAQKQYSFKKFLAVVVFVVKARLRGSDVLLGFLAKSTLHSKVIVKAANVLQMKFLAKVAYQSEIPFKITAKIKFAKQLRTKTPANLAKLGRTQKIYASLPNS